MKNKFMRSVTAMVVAVTMLISSQGVVTSFADGGEDSDMSESSSVQMNEVSNNGTDQSTEDDATQRTCGAKEGEPHKENCPLNVKPDDGNTNDGDTDNSAGEDTDIKSVVDAINALPAVEDLNEGTNYEELKAPEAKISELESGNQETAPSEAVQNVIEKIDVAVKQIDYTTETIPATDGTTVTKTHIRMLKDLDPANIAELKALIDNEAAHEQDETQPALTSEEAAKLSDARKAFEDAKAKYLSEGFSDAQLVARQAYDALATKEEKAQVTNYSLLTDMEANITYIMQAVNTLSEGEPVAMIGDKGYTTLDEAIAAAGDGYTIEILNNCSTPNGFAIGGKTDNHDNPNDLTINGNGHTITLGQKGIYIAKDGDTPSKLTFNNCNLDIRPASGTPTISGEGYPWAAVIINYDCELTFDNCTVNIQQPIGDTKVDTGLYYHVGSKINLNNTVMSVTEFTTNGFSADVNDEGLPYTSELNVLNGSNLTVSQNRAGLTAALKVTVTDSKLTNSNNRGNASNGADYIITNSEVDISGNGTHGMSARNVEIVNSNITCEGNGGFGVTYYGSMKMDGSSTLDANQNGNAGLRANNKGKTSDVASGAKVNILGNSHNGLENYGDFTFEDGVILRINNNDEVSTNGGGIYNAGSIILPSDTEIMNNHAKKHGGGICNDGTVTVPNGVKLYNNHADIAGDDIHLGSEDKFKDASITFYPVGSDWTLTQTQLPITGWYFDGNKDGTSVTELNTNRWSQGNYYDLANVTADGITLRGFQSLKAAHAYSYDPETPVNPGTEWQVSKSKTATNLDANYQSQVTLSLPSAQEQLVSDVVFVLDESSAYNAVVEEMDTMLNNLADHVAKNEAAVKVGVVVFRGNADTKDLELLTPDSIDDINAFVRTRPDVGGSNMMAGLQAAEAMLQNAPEDDSRKYMILIGDGITYTWSGENGEQLGVNFANADAPTIPMLASPDAFDVKHGNGYLPNDWSKHLNEVSSVMEKTISEKSSSYSRGVDISTFPFIRNDEKDTYTSSVDISLYKCDQLYRNLSSKYHCYTVMRSAPSLSDPSKTDGEIHPWGPSFMNYLANGKEVSFAEIQNDIYYLLDAGSQVVDVIGEGIDNVGNEYDFKFIDEADKLTLKVGNEVLPIHEKNGYYGFGEKLTSGDYAGHYPYELTYYPEGMGTRSLEVAGELFRWDINVPVSNFAPVQLTYTVQLTNPQTADGTYGQYDADGSEEYAGLYTNKMAILYPVDSNGVEGEQEAFQKPTVSYSISNGKPVDPPVDPEDPTPRPGGGGDEDDDTPTIINETPVPTTTIDDEDVPLTDLPEDTVTIDDEEVPLKDIPNTGDMIPVPAMVAAVISIGGIALLMKKHK